MLKFRGQREDSAGQGTHAAPAAGSASEMQERTDTVAQLRGNRGPGKLCQRSVAGSRISETATTVTPLSQPPTATRPRGVRRRGLTEAQTWAPVRITSSGGKGTGEGLDL